jgi:23S rRNA (adenine2503-C2)-methyltransferase
VTLTRYGAGPEQVAACCEALGEPPFRARQVVEGLWTKQRPLESLTNVPRVLRARLATELPLAFEPADRRTGDRGATVKWLWRARDGAEVETVLMVYERRATVCVSSQAGCAMGCTFCATGQAGFERHLDRGEILEQVLRAAHESPRRIANVVFMGMGEPLANLDEVWASVERLHADLGLSARHLTISTVGIVPAMRRLVGASLPVTLAVSLHAPDDELRERLVPVNRRYPVAAVVDAARDYAAVSGRRVTFEYACIAGVNDHPHQAERLATLLRGFRGGAHVNLIALNPTGGFVGRPAGPARIAAFARRLAAHGVRASVRRNRGVRIDAACGQLRSRRVAAVPAPRSARMRP